MSIFIWKIIGRSISLLIFTKITYHNHKKYIHQLLIAINNNTNIRSSHLVICNGPCIYILARLALGPFSNFLYHLSFTNCKWTPLFAIVIARILAQMFRTKTKFYYDNWRMLATIGTCLKCVHVYSSTIEKLILFKSTKLVKVDPFAFHTCLSLYNMSRQ